MHKPGTTDYKRERNAALYDRLNIVIPKGRKADVEAHINREGIKSVNSLVNDLLREEVGMTVEEWNETEKEEK